LTQSEETDVNGKASSYYYGDPRLFELAEDASPAKAAENARVLIFSQRNVERPVWHGGMYEFEDVIMSIDAAHMLAPPRRAGTRAIRLGRQLHDRARTRLGLPRLPDSDSIQVEGTFDLFFAVFHFPWQVSYLRQVKDWRRKSRKAVCFIIEQWLPEIEDAKPYLKMLGEFDHIFVFSRRSLPQLQAGSGTTVEYMPIGADTLASCPYPSPPPRTIDVYSMGRRRPEVHEVMLRLMREERISYIFDAFSAGRDPWINYVDQRMLLRHLLKRSRYFLAYRHNDSPEFRARTGGEEAIPSRYFESVASGPVILGSTPDCDDYRMNFDWPDATIPLPADAEAVEDTLRDLDAQPDRIARASANNIINALRRHDWVYRWQAILAAAGLTELPGINNRVAVLDSLAEVVCNGAAYLSLL
jgi:Glycosyl transferases group 1